MKNATLYLPGFHLATLRRKPRLASQKLADQFAEIRRKSISQLAVCFTHFIPGQALKPHRSGAQSRRRLFSKENTFWGFFSQILNADSGCSEVVRKFHAFAASRSMLQPSSSTSGNSGNSRDSIPISGNSRDSIPIWILLACGREVWGPVISILAPDSSRAEMDLVICFSACPQDITSICGNQPRNAHFEIL